MKQDIENIIKKNFYKEFKGEIIESFRGGRNTDGSIDEPYDRNIDKEIQQIIPLIADEVLKVVVEKIINGNYWDFMDKEMFNEELRKLLK